MTLILMVENFTDSCMEFDGSYFYNDNKIIQLDIQECHYMKFNFIEPEHTA